MAAKKKKLIREHYSGEELEKKLRLKTHWTRIRTLTPDEGQFDIPKCSTIVLTYPASASSLSRIVSGFKKHQFQCYFTKFDDLRYTNIDGPVDVNCWIENIMHVKNEHLDNINLRYSLKCLESIGYQFLDKLHKTSPQRKTSFYRFLKQKIEQSSVERIELVTQTIFKLVLAFDKDPYLDPVSVFEFHFSRVEVRPCNLESHYQYIKRIIVTPSRMIFVPPEPIAINRILRQHICYVDNFARVCFRDEDFSQFNVNSKQGTLNVRRVIDDGIRISDDIVFQFLGCSNSQLRSQGLWLFYPQCPITVESIRESVGDLNKMKTTQKYVTRMGLAFTATDFSLSDNIEIEVIPEKERIVGDKRYIFSDGVGCISPAVRDMIIKEKYGDNYQTQNQPVAFQVRVGGCKGMVAVNPTLGNRKVLQIRPSMIKFDSSHKQIEPCGYSGPRELHMNRQVIAILRAQGVPDNNFIKLQNNSLIELADMLTMERLASYEMGSKLRVRTSDLNRNNIRITTEPFLRRQLVSLYKFKIRDAINKTRFRIDHDKGRQMKGIMDETNTLNYGEIFVQYTDLSNYSGANNKKILEGDVFITKNPCLHPGDLKRVRAVNIPALYHLYDVVVFPAKGQRPHPNELSGSDLDGDEYFVCWEKSLMPQRDCEAAEYYIETIKPPTDVEEPTLAMTEAEINDFVFNYITKGSKLGQISNAHAIWGDRKSDGVLSPMCIKLASKHSDAVDFIKTGIAPIFEFAERSLIYPDWMMKPDKASYSSTTAIGKMFHVVEGLEYAILHLKVSEDNIKVDKIFLLDEPPSDSEVESAKKTYTGYCNELANIMVAYGLVDEGDIAAGCLNTIKMSLAKEHERNYDMREQCLSMYRSLQKKYRKIFFQQLGVTQDNWRHEEVKVLRQAAAWYWVTYNEPQPHQDLILLSFPWCVSSILVKIPELMNTNASPSVRSKLIAELKTWYAEKAEKGMNKKDKGTDVHKLLSLAEADKVTDISRHTYGLIPGNTFMYFVNKLPMTFALQLRRVISDGNMQDLSDDTKRLLDQMTDDFRKSSGNWAVSEVEVDDSTIMKIILTSDKSFLRKVNIIKCYCQKYEILGHTMYLILNWAERNNITNGEDSDLGISFIEFMLQKENSQIFPLAEQEIAPTEVVIGHYPHKNTASLYLEYLKWVIQNCKTPEESFLDKTLLIGAHELLSTEKCLIAAMREYHFVSYSLTFESSESFKQLSIIRKKDKKMCFNIAKATSFCAEFFNDPVNAVVFGKDSKIEIKIRETELGGVNSLVLEIWGDNPQKMNEIADALQIDEAKFELYGNYLFVCDKRYNQLNFVASKDIDKPMKQYFQLKKHELKAKQRDKKPLKHIIDPLYYDNNLKELVNNELLRKIRLMRDGLYNKISHGNLEVNTTFGKLKLRRCENGSLDKEYVSVNKDSRIAILKKLRGITRSNKETLSYVFKLLYEGIYYNLVFNKDFQPHSLSLEDIVWTDMMISNSNGADLNLMMTSTHQLEGEHLNHLPLTYDLKHGTKWIERVDKGKGIQLANKKEIPCQIRSIDVITEKKYRFIKDPTLKEMSFSELSIEVYQTMDNGYFKFSKSYSELKLNSKINTLNNSELIRNYQKVALDLVMERKVGGFWKNEPANSNDMQLGESDPLSRPPRRPHVRIVPGLSIPRPDSNITDQDLTLTNEIQPNINEPPLNRDPISTIPYNSSIPASTSNSVGRLARDCMKRNIQDSGDREIFEILTETETDSGTLADLVSTDSLNDTLSTMCYQNTANITDGAINPLSFSDLAELGDIKQSSQLDVHINSHFDACSKTNHQNSSDLNANPEDLEIGRVSENSDDSWPPPIITYNNTEENAEGDPPITTYNNTEDYASPITTYNNTEENAEGDPPIITYNNTEDYASPITTYNNTEDYASPITTYNNTEDYAPSNTTYNNTEDNADGDESSGPDIEVLQQQLETVE